MFAFVVCKGDRPTGDTKALVEELRAWVGEQLGAIAKPDDIRFADNLPKTRSGKIMRRLLRSIARGDEITQDISTLENPAIVEQLRGKYGRGIAARAAAAAPSGCAARLPMNSGCGYRSSSCSHPSAPAAPAPGGCRRPSPAGAWRRNAAACAPSPAWRCRRGCVACCKRARNRLRILVMAAMKARLRICAQRGSREQPVPVQ